MPPRVAPVASSLAWCGYSALEVPHQRIDAAEFEVTPEDQPDPFGLVLDDGDLAVLHLVAKGQGTADPKSLALGGGDLVADALGGDLPLELGKGQQHVERQPAHRCRGVELLGDRDKRDAMGIEQLDQLGEVGQRSREAIDLVDDDDVDLPGADIVQQSLQVRAIGRAAGISAVVIAGPDQGPAGMGLALDIGRCGIVLGIQRVELLVQAVLGGDPGVDGAANRFD